MFDSDSSDYDDYYDRYDDSSDYDDYDLLLARALSAGSGSTSGIRNSSSGGSSTDNLDTNDTPLVVFKKSTFKKLFKTHSQIYNSIFKYLSPVNLGKLRLANSQLAKLLDDQVKTKSEEQESFWLFMIGQQMGVSQLEVCKNILQDTILEDYHPMFKSAAMLYRLTYLARYKKNICCLCAGSIKVKPGIFSTPKRTTRRTILLCYCDSCFEKKLVMNMDEARPKYCLTDQEIVGTLHSYFTGLIEQREIDAYFDSLNNPYELEDRRDRIEQRYLTSLANNNEQEIIYRKDLEEYLIEQGMEEQDAKIHAMRAEFSSTKIKNDAISNAEDIAKEEFRRREMVDFFKNAAKKELKSKQYLLLEKSMYEKIYSLGDIYISSKIEANDEENLEIARTNLQEYAKILIKSKTFSSVREKDNAKLKELSKGEVDIDIISKSLRTTNNQYITMTYLTKELTEAQLEAIISAARREKRLADELYKNGFNYIYMDRPSYVTDWISDTSGYRTDLEFYSVVNKMIRHHRNLYSESTVRRCVKKLGTEEKMQVLSNLIQKFEQYQQFLLPSKKQSSPTEASNSSDASKDGSEMQDESDKETSNNGSRSQDQIDNDAEQDETLENDTIEQNESSEDANDDTPEEMQKDMELIESIRHLLDALSPFMKLASKNYSVPFYNIVFNKLSTSLFSLITDASGLTKKWIAEYVVENFIRVPGTYGKLYEYSVPPSLSQSRKRKRIPGTEERNNICIVTSPNKLLKKSREEAKKERKEHKPFSRTVPRNTISAESIAKTRPQRKRQKYSS